MRWVVLVVLGLGLGGCSLFLEETESGSPESGCASVPLPDDDCDSGVCDRVTGDCIEEAVYVDPGGSDDNACTQEIPCLSLRRGLEVAVSNGIEIVHVAPESYLTDVTFSSNATVRVLGYDGVTLAGMPGNTILSMTAGKLVIEGANFQAGGQGTIAAISVTDAELELRRVRVDFATGDGIVASRSTLLVESSVVFSNGGFGVSAIDSTLVIRSSEIWQNAGGGVNFPGSSADIALSTVVDNFGTGIECLGGGGDVEMTGVIAMANNGTATDCPPNSFLASHVEGLPNMLAAPAFVDRPAGDFRLTDGSPGLDLEALVDAARDIDIDVDGQPRVQGEFPDFGANERPVP